MENLTTQKAPIRKQIAIVIPPKRPTVDEGYLVLRQGLTNHISRSSYQEYFFRNSNELKKNHPDDESFIS